MLKPPFLAVGRTTLTITRKTAGSYVGGRYVEGSPSTLDIVANVQPGLKYNDLQFLPEGERGRKALRVYTDTLIRTRKEGTAGYDADEFVWTDGLTYQFVFVHNYEVGPLQHWKGIAVAKEVT